jgi:hypothetical protein
MNLFKNLNMNIFQKGFLKYSRSYSSVYVNHRDANFNNDQTPFDFTPENYKKIEHILVYNINIEKISNTL